MNNNQPVSLHDLLADILGAKGIVGCPPEIAVDALRKTAIDFCTQSTIWEYHDQFQVQYNVADYPIEVPEGSRVASMRWVAVNGFLLLPNTTGTRPVANTRAFNPNSFYNGYYASGQGYTFTMDGRDFFWITPVPVDSACCDQVTFCAALKPTQDACELPYILAEDWNDALSSGTAARLFALPKQEWSNAGLAVQNRMEYQRWIARARLTKAQGYTQAALVATGSYF